MKALVTGGAGFIGSHLVDELVRQKYKVIVIDNLSTGDIKNLKFVKSKIKFVKCDLSKNNNFTKYLNGVDYIFHLAGLSRATESIKIPYKYYEANFLSTVNILNSIGKFKIKKFIYSASASCYGNAKKLPISENAKIQPLSPYALTKWLSEQAIMQRANSNNFPAISLRLFNVYGPRTKASSAYSGAISVFVKQKLNHKPLTVIGDGLQSRSFIHVSDVVSAMIKMAKSKISNEIFNVGSQKTLQINKIVKLLGGKKINIPERLGDPRHSSADIKKIKKYLKWSPKIPIDVGIKLLLKDYD